MTYLSADVRQRHAPKQRHTTPQAIFINTPQLIAVSLYAQFFYYIQAPPPTLPPSSPLSFHTACSPARARIPAPLATSRTDTLLR